MARKTRGDEFAIIGLGKFGISLALRLEELGNKVLAIDRRAEIVQWISTEVTQAATLDAENLEALKAVDIASFSTVIIAIGNAFEANLLITDNLKTIGVKTVISKANSDQEKNILIRVGADRVVQPEQDEGVHLAEELSAPNLLDRIPLGFSHSLGEVIAPAKVINQSIRQSNIREVYDVSILLILRGDDLFVSPTPETIIQEKDILVLLGENDKVVHFCNLE